ncbi:MAG TPA: DinB family protein [Candidatus Angelobacter sp.]|nr:DinB family protein [Candidatus Angelobacter sp.]
MTSMTDHPQISTAERKGAPEGVFFPLPLTGLTTPLTRTRLAGVNAPEPSISFGDLLAYTDYLAQRWLNYFKQNPAALDVDVGGKTGSLRDLVTHIFQVENFFAGLLAKEGAGSMAAPPKMDAPSLDDLGRLHQEAHKKLAEYIAAANEERLEKARTVGAITVSERKILAQTVLHSVHHWAQVAMEVRQAGFPAERPQDIIASPVMK